MSVPSQPSASSPSDPLAPPAKDGGSKFGALPIGGFVTVALAIVGGVAAYVISRGRTVTAMCGGERMSPGDLCETTRNGVRTGTQTYTEVLASALRTNQTIQWVGILLIVIGVVFGVLIFLRWRQDVALKQQLTNEYGTPISQHSRTASSMILGIIFGAGFSGLAIFMALTGVARDQPGYFAGTALFGALGLLFLYLAFPKNGQLIQTYDQGVRVIAGGKQHTIAWNDLDYTIIPAKGAANHAISGPGLKQLVLTGLQGANDLQSLAQQRSVDAKYRPAIDAINRGETVTFGPLGVSREGITYGRKTLPWSEFAGVVLHQGNVTVAKAPKGSFAGMTLGKVPNYALFVHLTSAVAKQQPN